MQDTLIEIARSVEAAALSPQAGRAALPLDAAVTSALLRSRRLRVLDWLAQSGFSLINILDGVETVFLKFAETHDSSDKYSTARQLYKLIAPALPLWTDQVAQLEVLLIEARRPRAQVYPPGRDSDLVRLVGEAVIGHIDLNAALEIHHKIPAYDVPREARRHYQDLVEQHPNRPQPGPVLAAGPTAEVSGIVASLEPIAADMLSEAQFTWGALRARLGAETAAALIGAQLITMAESQLG